jgi:zinc transport system substrate-binding protein
MLLKPGAEMHSYEPTPQDIINISNADIFIYVGGDSDNWIEDVLKDINTDKTKIIKLMDLVDVVEEEHVEGMEEHEEEEEEVEYDEHVWTSPINAITIINKLKEEIIKVDNDNKSLYEDNSNNYTNELSNIDNEIRSLVKNAKRKELIFGDRFPIRYFVEEYGLSYYAAFPGCSEQTEASAKTITFLINKVKKDNIPVIFHIELSNGNIAKTIAEETGAKVLEFKTAHNISQDDFDAGITYVDIMKSNIEVLKEAIN